jgi:hypothetical protein
MQALVDEFLATTSSSRFGDLAVSVEKLVSSLPSASAQISALEELHVGMSRRWVHGGEGADPTGVVFQKSLSLWRAALDKLRAEGTDESLRERLRLCSRLDGLDEWPEFSFFEAHDGSGSETDDDTRHSNFPRLVKSMIFPGPESIKNEIVDELVQAPDHVLEPILRVLRRVAPVAASRLARGYLTQARPEVRENTGASTAAIAIVSAACVGVTGNEGDSEWIRYLWAPFQAEITRKRVPESALAPFLQRLEELLKKR